MNHSNVLTADDYGFYGKGTSGYVHYMAGFENGKRSSGGGGGGGGGGCGCFLQILVYAGILMLIGKIVNCASS